MRLSDLEKLERELRAFTGQLFDGMGRSERREAMRLYVLGLLLDGERKSIQPMASRLVDDVSEVEAMRQRLQGCVVVSSWPDDEVRCRLARKVDAELPGIEAFVIDDTGFPKKGTHSVGVQRQYSGTLGRRDNCQVATSLHLAGELGSACIAFRLYLPESWTDDRRRCRAAKVPVDVVFEEKWKIALNQIDAALAWGVRKQVVLADAGYGDIPSFREALEARDLKYVVGVQGSHLLWPPGAKPALPPPSGQKGRPRTQYVAGDFSPLLINRLTASLGPSMFRPIRWRDGSRGIQSSRFAFLRIHMAERHHHHRPPSGEQWLISEWPKGETSPTKFWLSNLPVTTSKRELIRLVKLRWRVERDYQELKQEIGLDHFEGRTWRGFHHHATLCAAAHAFLALRRALFPPEQNALDSPDGATCPPASASSFGRVLSAMPAPSN